MTMLDFKNMWLKLRHKTYIHPASTHGK